MQTALTIAGSDSSGGAGVQADIKTFAAHGVFGVSAITAITAQNTTGVSAMLALPPDLVTAQIDAVAGDFDIAATKIGMLANAAIIHAVADAIARHGLRNLVVDPVMVASRGSVLLDTDGVTALRERLIKGAAVVTPNTTEARVLTGLSVESVENMRQAAEALVSMGARAAVVTGGHLDGPPIDVLFDGRDFLELSADRVDTIHTHGTGCTLAAAIAARIALGDGIADALRAAKAYVTLALQQAPGLGRGHGPLQHFPQLPAWMAK
jgi:hydroxymethylpyrimidine/phosphomethylpyrimidine kinase